MIAFSCGHVYPRTGPLCYSDQVCPECIALPGRQMSAANARRARACQIAGNTDDPPVAPRAGARPMPPVEPLIDQARKEDRNERV